MSGEIEQKIGLPDHENDEFAQQAAKRLFDSLSLDQREALIAAEKLRWVADEEPEEQKFVKIQSTLSDLFSDHQGIRPEIEASLVNDVFRAGLVAQEMLRMTEADRLPANSLLTSWNSLGLINRLSEKVDELGFKTDNASLLMLMVVSDRTWIKEFERRDYLNEDWQGGYYFSPTLRGAHSTSNWYDSELTGLGMISIRENPQRSMGRYYFDERFALGLIRDKLKKGITRRVIDDLDVAIPES